MTLIEIILTGLSLSMDAFTVSIIKGLESNTNRIKTSLIISFFFGIFQSMMPIIGYKIGHILSSRIINLNPYISMILLISIGILMLKNDNKNIETKLNYKELIILSIATSIDALVIGISFSFLKINITFSSLIIGIITFILCIIGYNLGSILNRNLGKYANIIGGITLIIIGIKILLQHLLK